MILFVCLFVCLFVGKAESMGTLYFVGENMSVLELSRSEGMQYALQNPVYQQDKMDCLVNQTKSFSSGTLFLNEE